MIQLMFWKDRDGDSRLQETFTRIEMESVGHGKYLERINMYLVEYLWEAVSGQWRDDGLA